MAHNNNDPLENEMAYIVVYQREDGSSAVESCATLDGAISTAERLRNRDAVERPQIFETKEVRYDFEPYYRVQVISEESSPIDDVDSGTGLDGDSAADFDFTSDAAADMDTDDPVAVDDAVAVDESAVVDDAVADESAVVDESAAVESSGTVVATDPVVETNPVVDTAVDDTAVDDTALDGTAANAPVSEDRVADLEMADDETMPPPPQAQDAIFAESTDQIAAATPPPPEVVTPDGAPTMEVPSSVSGAVDADVDMPDADMPDVDMPDADMADVDMPDADMADIDLRDAAPEAEVQKTGLFEKFVNSLEGNSGAAVDSGDVSDVADGAGDLVDGTETVNPRRGLFGR